MIAALGRAALNVLAGLGAFGLVLGRTLLHLPRLERREFVRALVHFGARSLPLTLGVGAVAGATVVVQTTLYTQRFGARSVLGWAAGYAVIWEFGPLLLGLMMAGRLGARNAAELAMLEVDGQLEGLRGISLDPFRLLVAPRVAAMVVSVAALCGVLFVTAILTEAIGATFALGLPIRVFFGSFSQALSPADLIGGTIKATAFGAAIAIVSTAVGLRAEGGARAVGVAAAKAVAWSAGAIFALDFALTPLLASLWR